MLEPTSDNPITDADRRFASLLDLDPKTVWVARQPLPSVPELDAMLGIVRDENDHQA